MRNLSIVLGGALGLFVASCGDDETGTEGGENVCEPGKTDSCACPDGSMGAQTCEDDGSAWGDCVCGGADDDGGTGDGGDDGGTGDDGSGSGADDGTTGSGGGTDDGGETSAETGASDTGGGGNLVTLQNDSFVSGALTGYQAGFVENECFASVFVADAADYPFTIHSVQVLVGPGPDMGNVEFAIHDVDGSNMPTTKVTSVDLSMTGSMDSFNEVRFSSIPELISPVYQAGDVFAASICLRYTTDPYDPFTMTGGANPTIFNDMDGVTAGRNWLYAIDTGQWGLSGGFGVSGDWILRAIIEPM